MTRWRKTENLFEIRKVDEQEGVHYLNFRGRLIKSWADFEKG